MSARSSTGCCRTRSRSRWARSCTSAWRSTLRFSSSARASATSIRPWMRSARSRPGGSGSDTPAHCRRTASSSSRWRPEVGLFKELALLPLAPVRGTAWVAEQVAEEADRQLYDEDNIKRELVQLEIDAEEGRIGPKERAAKEDDLLERLAVTRQRELEEQDLVAAEAWEMEEPVPEPTSTTEERSNDG